MPFQALAWGSLRYYSPEAFICMYLNAESCCQNTRTRKTAKKPEDHRGRTSRRASDSEDENPPPVDLDVDSEVLKKGRKGVDRTFRTTSASDNNLAVVKDVRKESQIIISDKVWFLIIVKFDAYSPLACLTKGCQCSPTHRSLPSRPNQHPQSQYKEDQWWGAYIQSARVCRQIRSGAWWEASSAST